MRDSSVPELRKALGREVVEDHAAQVAAPVPMQLSGEVSAAVGMGHPQGDHIAVFQRNTSRFFL